VPDAKRRATHRKGVAKIPKPRPSMPGSGGLAGCTRSVCRLRPQAMEQMVRGYKVKVSRGSSSPEDAGATGAAIAEVLARSLKAKE